MKKLRKIFNKASSATMHDVLGVYKNVLFVGQQNQFTADVMKRLEESFNLFCIFELEMLVDKSKLALFQPYDMHQSVDQRQILMGLKDLLEDKKRKFDAIVINEHLPIPMVTDLHSDELFSKGNLRLIEDTVKKNLIAYKIARDHLHTYGSIINIVKYSSFESTSNEVIQNCLQNQNLHLSFLMSDLKSLDYQNRIHTLLYDELESLSAGQQTYQDAVAKALINWIHNKRVPEHNSFVHFKFDSESQRLSTIYN